MLGKYFFHKKQGHFYRPGEEIYIDENKGFIVDDSISSVKVRIYIAISTFICIFAILIFRLFNLCVIQANDITTPTYYSSNDNITDDIMNHISLSIKRADILDRNGTIIATSLPTVHLHANASKIKNKKETAEKLAAILNDMPYENILHKLQSNRKFIYIKRNLSPSQQYQINALGNPWLEFEKSEKRIYPHKNLFSHIIGFTNIDNKGVSGLEKHLDTRLTQSDIPLNLTIDAGLQDTIRSALLEAVNAYRADRASAILMDVRSGEILSMISLPDFDPNSLNDVSDKAKFNFSTTGVYEPGSVLKIFNAAMGLETGKVKLSDKFDATKPLKLKHNIIKDYRGENRWLDLSEILIYSSNIGSAHIALKVGKKEQRDFLENLGFFEPISSIEVTEKAVPIIPSEKKWSESTTATVGYGYGISVTPLHLISAFSSVVNGGIYFPPTLVQQDKKQESHRILSQRTSMQMRNLLRGVVTDGSGKRANITGYEVAGKTGTAEKLVKGKYVDKKVTTSFLATFPASDPQYALFLMLDEPKATKDTYGYVTSGWNTVPTAGKIITNIAPQLGLLANEDLYESRKERIINAAYSVRKK